MYSSLLLIWWTIFISSISSHSSHFLAPLLSPLGCLGSSEGGSTVLTLATIAAFALIVIVLIVGSWLLYLKFSKQCWTKICRLFDYARVPVPAEASLVSEIPLANVNIQSGENAMLQNLIWSNQSTSPLNPLNQNGYIFLAKQEVLQAW